MSHHPIQISGWCFAVRHEVHRITFVRLIFVQLVQLIILSPPLFKCTLTQNVMESHDSWSKLGHFCLEEILLEMSPRSLDIHGGYSLCKMQHLSVTLFLQSLCMHTHICRGGSVSPGHLPYSSRTCSTLRSNGVTIG